MLVSLSLRYHLSLSRRCRLSPSQSQLSSSLRPFAFIWHLLQPGSERRVARCSQSWKRLAFSSFVSAPLLSSSYLD